MYPSDNYMVYGNGVNSACYNTPANSSNCNSTNAQTGWVYNSNIREGQSNPDYTWLLSPLSGGARYAFHVTSAGRLNHYSVHNNTLGVRPVVYLKSNIKIAGGTGEVGSEYTLEEIQ